MFHYDLIVIGAGPGGYTAALRAAKRGWKTAVIERREVGGTCLNRGCIPTKTLLHASEIAAGIRGGRFGIEAQQVRLDMAAMLTRKRQVSAQLSGGIETMLRAEKVKLLQGNATVLGPSQVRLTGENEQVLTARHILLATGAVPARPPIPGLDLPEVMTSDDLLENGRLYQSLIVIGGGVIGVEFATFYADLGCQVTVIEGMDRLLPALDRELGQNLGMIFKKRGIAVHTGADVTRLEKTEGGVRVCFHGKGGEESAAGEAVLCAIGRRPNTEGLFAPDVAVAMNGRFMAVNENYETSLPGIYAIGDVSGNIQLAHMAAAQGIDAVERMMGGAGRIDLTAVPSCIYCAPEIACVGMTAEEAKAEGRAVAVGKYVMYANGRTVIQDGGRAFLKIVADAESHAILGAQFMCEHATDMISEMTAAIVNGLTVEQMLRAMRPHPTFEEGVQDALEAVLGKLSGAEH